MSHFEAIHKLLSDGGDLLIVALADPGRLEPPAHLEHEYPDFARIFGTFRLEMYRSSLLLWLDPDSQLIKGWDESTRSAAIYAARSMRQPDSFLPYDVRTKAAEDLSQARQAFADAINRWLNNARSYLREISPN
jgi:hypothetical protein